MHRIAGDKGHLGFTRTRERDDLVVVAGLHQLLFDALSDLPGHLFGARPWPVGAYHHGFESKGRVFALAQLGVGNSADYSQQQHEVQDDLAVTQRPGGEVEIHRAYSSTVRSALAVNCTARLSRSTGRTCWPSRNT